LRVKDEIEGLLLADTGLSRQDISLPMEMWQAYATGWNRPIAVAQRLSKR
jgi:hypothetical protein